MVVGVVYQHLAFFRQGATLLSRIEGPYSDALGIVEHVCKQGQIKKVCELPFDWLLFEAWHCALLF